MSTVAVWIHRKIAVGYEPINAKPRNITLIQVYGPTTAATDEEMERFYQDLSQAIKQVPKRDMLTSTPKSAEENHLQSHPQFGLWLRRNE